MSKDEESIFAHALALDSSEARASYLADACENDSSLHERIDALLRSHEEASGLLNPKIAETAALPKIGSTGETIGPYKLLQQIGEGGFGIVYMAEQQKPVRRKVALKIIKPGMDTSEVIARFEAERQALALMDHPNIAKVLDAGATETGRPYFVMELVKGIPLTQFSDENSLSMQQRLELFVSVCHAIQHAHQKGVIHRDLKPSNVMVTIHDNKPVPKVIDFGVSKAISQQLTERTLFTAYGQMIGTPVYMSPEQAQMSGLDIDTRSDIYSLGVMLYELLTGSTPLDSERLRKSGYAEMQRLIREEEAPKPSDRLSTQGGEALAKIAKCRSTESGQLNREVRGDLDWIVMKALEKDRNRRYETANGFAADVERFLKKEAVVACPPTAAYRFRKFMDRNRKGVLLAGTVAAALLLAIVGLTVGYLRAEKSAHDARAAWQIVSEEQERTQQERDRAEKQRAQAENQRMQAENQRTIAVKQSELAEAATATAMVAERERTESLTDVYTALGAAAVQRKEKAQAMLWFANAAKIAPDSERERYNRIRARTYSNDMLAPIAAFQHDATFVGRIEIHRDNQLLMTQELGENHTSKNLDLGEIKICDIYSSQESELPAQWLPLKAATWSPDGETLAVVTQAREFIEVNFATKTVVNQICDNEAARLIQYSPSGKLLCAFGKESIRIWNTETGGFATPDLPHPDVVTGIDFSPNEEFILTTCVDDKARLFDTSGNAEQLVEFEHSFAISRHRPQICYPAIFVDDQRVCVNVRNKETTTIAVQIRDIHGSMIKRLGSRRETRLSNRKGQFIVAHERSSVVVTDIKTYEQSRLRMPTNEIQFALSPKEDLIAIAGIGRMELRNVNDFELVEASNAKSRYCNYCTFSPDGELLCTCERGGLVKIWQRIKRYSGKYSVRVGSSYAEVSPDGQHFATVGLSQRSSRLPHLAVYDINTGKQVFRKGVSHGFRLFTPQSTLTDGKFFPAGNTVVVAVADSASTRRSNPGEQPGRIVAYNWRDRHAELSVELESEPRSLDVSSDGKHVAALSADGRVTVIDAKDGNIVDRWRAHSPSLSNNWYINNGEIAFSPDSTRIVTWGTEDFARVWDCAFSEQVNLRDSAPSREPLFHLQHAGLVHDLQFSPNGKLIATSDREGMRLQVWDFATGKRVAPEMKHPDWVFGLRFSPSGDQIVTTCRDSSARVWDWKMGELACPPMAHDDEVHDAAFLDDGKTIVTTCYEGTLGIWETTTATRLAPPIKVDGQPTRLELTPDCSHVILGGHSFPGHGVTVVDLQHLLRHNQRSLQDLVTSAEFFTGHRINSAKAQRLTNEKVVAIYDQNRDLIHSELGVRE